MASSPFNGRIPIEQIAAGIEAVVDNVCGLVADAELLLGNGRHSRALAISVTALEEAGKISVLAAMSSITAKTQKMWRRRWREYRDHGVKSMHGRSQALGPDARVSFESLAQELPMLVSFSGDAEDLRQGGLYVDYDSERGSWRQPQEIPPDDAASVVQRAREARDRLLDLQARGLCSETVLRVKNEIYGPFAEKFHFDEPEALMDLDAMTFLRALAEARAEFFARLEELGIDWSGEPDDADDPPA